MISAALLEPHSAERVKCDDKGDVEPLFKLRGHHARHEEICVDQIVSSALASQVSAQATRESAASRVRRVHWPKVDQILSRVPDVPPPTGDET